MAVITSCYDCSDRVIGCHSHCSRYITEREELKEAKQVAKENEVPVLTAYDFNKELYSSEMVRKINNSYT